MATTTVAGQEEPQQFRQGVRRLDQLKSRVQVLGAPGPILACLFVDPYTETVRRVAVDARVDRVLTYTARAATHTIEFRLPDFTRLHRDALLARELESTIDIGINFPDIDDDDEVSLVMMNNVVGTPKQPTALGGTRRDQSETPVITEFYFAAFIGTGIIRTCDETKCCDDKIIRTSYADKMDDMGLNESPGFKINGGSVVRGRAFVFRQAVFSHRPIQGNLVVTRDISREEDYDIDWVLPAKNTTKCCLRCHAAAAKQCKGCKAVRYCSAECQRADWGEHRAACNPKSLNFLNI